MKCRVLGIKHLMNGANLPTSEIAIWMPDSTIGIAELPTEDALALYNAGWCEVREGEPTLQ